MSADGLITDREIIRDEAPDILLTNYKMLDQLLLRTRTARSGGRAPAACGTWCWMSSTPTTARRRHRDQHRRRGAGPAAVGWAPAAGPGSDADRLVEGLRHPAAQMSFTWIENNAELRRVIEGGDFGAWRVFLHPEQRKYARRSYSGPFRLSGGAGTGKTVVLLHRARMLARREPGSRILLTTHTVNLADQLRTALLRERSLLYVAATRARDELALSWSGDPSQLLPAARLARS